MSARYWRLESFGVDLLRADDSTHRYARHSHEGYALGVVEKGAHSFGSRGRRWTAVSGSIVIVNPDDAHDGGPATRDGEYSYRMFYVDPQAWRTALEESAGRRSTAPFFQVAVTNDVALAERFSQVHRALEQPTPALAREAMLVTALVELARRYDTGPFHGEVAARRAPREITRALEYVTAHFADDISLAELARVAGLDRFGLLRSFQRSFGLPPHRYQTQLRLRHARGLLRAGEAPAMAAAAAGFADQSHLIRTFKAAYGVTPGQYLGS